MSTNTPPKDLPTDKPEVRDEHMSPDEYWYPNSAYHGVCKNLERAVEEIEKLKAELAEAKCPRCGDMFYDPRVIIKDKEQHAAEWEEVAKRAEKELERLRGENERLESAVTTLSTSEHSTITLLKKERDELKARLAETAVAGGALAEAACKQRDTARADCAFLLEYLGKVTFDGSDEAFERYEKLREKFKRGEG